MADKVGLRPMRVKLLDLSKRLYHMAEYEEDGWEEAATDLLETVAVLDTLIAASVIMTKNKH